MRKFRDRLAWAPATEKEILEFYGGPAPWTLRALAFWYDGELCGIGGVAWQNKVWVAFSDIKTDVTVPAITIWRSAKLVMKEIVFKMSVPVYTCPNSAKWARLLGFKQCETQQEGIFVCQP